MAGWRTVGWRPEIPVLKQKILRSTLWLSLIGTVCLCSCSVTQECVAHALTPSFQMEEGKTATEWERQRQREREMLMKAEQREYKLSQQLCRGLRGRLSRPSSMSALIMSLEQCGPLWTGYFAIFSSCPTTPPCLSVSPSHTNTHFIDMSALS